MLMEVFSLERGPRAEQHLGVADKSVLSRDLTPESIPYSLIKMHHTVSVCATFLMHESIQSPAFMINKRLRWIISHQHAINQWSQSRSMESCLRGDTRMSHIFDVLLGLRPTIYGGQGSRENQ
jgi:hypothetical protein